MQGLARKRMDDEEDAPEAIRQPQVRPEELRLLEALLFAANEPLDEKTLAARLPDGVDAAADACACCRPNTRRAASIWCRSPASGRSAPRNDLSWLLTREAIEPRKLSRAAIETLAIIAYHQPVTRAEIEEIRGVSMSKGTLDVLLETGWIRLRGRRKAPGRPVTYGTTDAFLVAFRARAIERPAGPRRTEGRRPAGRPVAAGFSVPVPSDDPTLREDEDPLEPGDLDLGLAPRAELDDAAAGPACESCPQDRARGSSRGVAAARAGADRWRSSAAERRRSIAAQLTFERVTHRYGDITRRARRLARHRAGRDRLPARPFRLRQDDAAAARRRRRAADAGRILINDREVAGGAAFRAAGTARRRPDVPGLRAVSASDRSSHNVMFGLRAARAPRPSARRARARRASASRPTRTPIRTCCRAASSSAWRWRARSRRARACC